MREVKKVAAETNQSPAALIEYAVREYLSRGRETASRRSSSFPADGEGGLQPGVSIDDGRALRELLAEGR